jgi:hypothetical protein
VRTLAPNLFFFSTHQKLVELQDGQVNPKQKETTLAALMSWLTLPHDLYVFKTSYLNCQLTRIYAESDVMSGR